MNHHHHPSAMTLPARAGVAVIHAYQLVLAPWFGGACRFEPSCSQYAIAALGEHGLLCGAWLAARRLARCHPFGGFGFDPVPPRRGD
jgi:putative membrane protein insertion efficiency factor